MKNNSSNIFNKILTKDIEVIKSLIYSDNKIVILFVTIIIIILISLIIYLSLNLRKRKQLESDLKKMNDELLDTQEELQMMAYYDDIVGLPNRNMFYKTMQDKFDSNFVNQLSGSILYMDIDNFKNINDTFGHAFGNLLLKKVAERLKAIKSISEKADHIFRLSGDEYMIVLEDRDKKETEKVAMEIQRSFYNPFFILSESILITISMGIVFYPKDGYTVDEIFKKADLAMYKVKELGKNGYKIYEEKMEEEVFNRVLLENHLRNALDKNEFILNYQPQINPKNGQVVGFESLIRWNSSKYGLVSPAKFIPMAEETGEINKIGEWVLKEACEFTKRLNKKYQRRMEVSVNISPVQLNKMNFIEIVERVLKETGSKNCLLGIEVTETALMESFDDSIKKIEKLKSMGIKVYLDDFGTGYSSLNYLLKLPIDTIKIDKSFIDDMMTESKGQKIIYEIINLAHDIDLEVIAEGVEIEEQVSILKDFNCDVIQGYVYSKPLSEEDVYKFLDKEMDKSKI